MTLVGNVVRRRILSGGNQSGGNQSGGNQRAEMNTEVKRHPLGFAVILWIVVFMSSQSLKLVFPQMMTWKSQTTMLTTGNKVSR